MEFDFTPPRSPEAVEVTPAPPLSPLSPLAAIGGLTFKEVTFELQNKERDEERDRHGQDTKFKTTRAKLDQGEGFAKRKQPGTGKEIPNKRAKGDKGAKGEKEANWVSTHHPKPKPLKDHLMKIGSSSTGIPWSDSPQEGAFLRAVKKEVEVLKKKTLLSYYASDCPKIPNKKFKELLRQDPEKIAYMVQLTASGKTFYVDGSKSKDPSAKINHKWSPLLTNVRLQDDGSIVTTCRLELFPATSVELFMSYGDSYWYHRLCSGHELFEEDKDFDELSEESQKILSAYMRVVLPDNVEKLTEEEQMVYMSHWDATP